MLKEKGGVVGILGPSPRGIEGPIRVGRFDQFQRQAGEIEQAAPGSFWAGHAACHCFMNGVARVVFSGVQEPEVPRSWLGALSRLFLDEEPGLELLIIPGIEDPDLSAQLLGRFLASTDSAASYGHREPPTLWLDAPDHASVDEILRYAERIGADGERVRLATPRISVISPGRRSYERLPASCLIAPLALGLADALGAVHDLDGPEAALDIDDLGRLQAAGCGVLAPRGKRQQLAAAFSLERPRAPDLSPHAPELLSEPLPSNFAGVSARLEEDLEAATRDLSGAGLRGGALRAAALREARAVLSGYKARGEIAGFVARCDEETCAGAEGEPVVEVHLNFPKRVSQVRLELRPKP